MRSQRQSVRLPNTDLHRPKSRYEFGKTREQFTCVHILRPFRSCRRLALVEVADRIGAVGGSVAVEPLANGSISIEAVIPCEP